MSRDIVERLASAERRAEYWKAEHHAANAEIEKLRGLLRDMDADLAAGIAIVRGEWIARIRAALPDAPHKGGV